MSNAAIGGNLSLDSSRVRLNIGKKSNTEFDSSIRFYDGLSYIKVGADVGDMTIYSGDQITLDCPVDSGGVHIKAENLTFDQSSARLKLGTKKGTNNNYNSSIIFPGGGFIMNYYNSEDGIDTVEIKSPDDILLNCGYGDITANCYINARGFQ
jgi:hypothetical protein